MTNILLGDILLAKSRNALCSTNNTADAVVLIGGNVMFIYDRLNYLEENNEQLGVNPLSYVVLSCAR